MYACACGDVELAKKLLAAGANSNVKIPIEYQKYPYVHPELRNWTALNFAVIKGSIPILKVGLRLQQIILCNNPILEFLGVGISIEILSATYHVIYL